MTVLTGLLLFEFAAYQCSTSRTESLEANPSKYPHNSEPAFTLREYRLLIDYN